VVENVCRLGRLEAAKYVDDGFKMPEDRTYEVVKKYLESEWPGKSKADGPKLSGKVEF
jgi:hypothetical protein